MNAHDGFAIVIPAEAPSIAQGFEGGLNDNDLYAHLGIDIVAAIGTPVLAVAPGEVTVVSGDPLSGKRIVIHHGKDQAGTGHSTHYYHLDRQSVKVGEWVQRGQIIGSVGATGLLAPYPHLHFELHQGEGFGRAVNPHLYWLEGIGRVTCYEPGISDPPPNFRMTYPVACKPL